MVTLSINIHTTTCDFRIIIMSKGQIVIFRCRCWFFSHHCLILPFPNCKGLIRDISLRCQIDATRTGKLNRIRKLIWVAFLCKLCTKGQLISKWFFGVVDFLQKMNKNKSTRGIIVVESNSFVHFLEEIDDPKNHFEIS